MNHRRLNGHAHHRLIRVGDLRGARRGRRLLRQRRARRRRRCGRRDRAGREHHADHRAVRVGDLRGRCAGRGRLCRLRLRLRRCGGRGRGLCARRSRDSTGWNHHADHRSMRVSYARWRRRWRDRRRSGRGRSRRDRRLFSSRNRRHRRARGSGGGVDGPPATSTEASLHGQHAATMRARVRARRRRAHGCPEPTSEMRSAFIVVRERWVH